MPSSINRDIDLASKYHRITGLTGTHVFGRGHEKTDGTYTDEKSRRSSKKLPVSDDTQDKKS